jgi:hypothetical protein
VLALCTCTIACNQVQPPAPFPRPRLALTRSWSRPRPPLPLVRNAFYCHPLALVTSFGLATLGSFEYITKLTMPDDTAGCAFGTSLSLTKGLPYRLAVGAPSCNNATGAVAVFTVSPALDSYALEAVLTNPASNPGDKFGFIVSAIGEKGFCAVVVRCDCGEFGQCRGDYSTKFTKQSVCTRSKDWRCCARVVPARSPWRTHVACVPRSRHRQSFSHTLMSEIHISVE